MEEQLQSSENNTQGQQIVTTKRGRGRPPRNQSASVQNTTQLEIVPTANATEANTQNSEELEQLKSQLQQLQEENLKLKQIAETVAVTTTKKLIECTDDEINSLYVDYITKHETTHENAIVVEADNKVIIPKSYYVIG
jgi:CxxC motif-containing protein (DUF1111 family)